MRRVITYIDGFNLYHAIDDLKKSHLKRVDLVSLAESLLRDGEALAAVKYFSAYATWMPTRYARHRDYVAALKHVGATPFMAQFKGKPRRCFDCGARWTGHEEKETDVQIAVHMVTDALAGEVDRIIAVSADTDLSPAIRMIASRKPECEVFVTAPPGRLRFCRALKPQLELTPGRIGKHLLPDSIALASGRTIARPEKYKPPA